MKVMLLPGFVHFSGAGLRSVAICYYCFNIKRNQKKYSAALHILSAIRVDLAKYQKLYCYEIN